METDAAVNIFILQMNKVSERSNNLSKFAQLVSGIPEYFHIHLSLPSRHPLFIFSNLQTRKLRSREVKSTQLESGRAKNRYQI